MQCRLQSYLKSVVIKLSMKNCRIQLIHTSKNNFANSKHSVIENYLSFSRSNHILNISLTQLTQIVAIGGSENKHTGIQTLEPDCKTASSIISITFKNYVSTVGQPRKYGRYFRHIMIDETNTNVTFQIIHEYVICTK